MKRLAINTDGQLTYCSAPPDKLGMGRCNHVEHQNESENPNDFIRRIEKAKNMFSNSGGRKDGSGHGSSSGGNGGGNQNKVYKAITAVVLGVGLTFGAINGEAPAKVEQKFEQLTQEVKDLFSDYDNKQVTQSKPIDNTEIRKEIQQLEDRIEISERRTVPYDRDSWGLYTKSFTYRDGNKLYKTTSTRKAGLYKSELYDPKSQTYLDPYTNNQITDFKRWSGKGALQFDHIIPLSYVNSQVGDKWNEKQKSKYAYDLTIGVDADASLNGAKSDKGPSEFLPPVNQAAYCYSWLKVADQYDIPLAKRDMETIKRVLNNSKAEDIKIINPYRS